MTQPAGEKLDTFPRLLASNASRRGHRAACREKQFGIWQKWTWRDVAREVRELALGLRALGLAEGDRVAIIGNNRPQLYWSMVASQSAGAVPVPIYQDGVAEEMVYVLDHAEVRFAIVEDQEQVDKLLSIKDRLVRLEHIIYVDPRGLRNYDHSTLHPFSTVQAEGRNTRATHEPDIERIIAAQTGSSTCVMLYTSGTTGRPKGVVLSNDNIIKTAQASVEFDRLRARDEILAYLPMAWVVF